MKKVIIFTVLIVTVMVCGIVTMTEAVLTDLGSGLIYDDDFNLMWVQNANLAGYKMPWEDAVAWAENLVYGGYDDWRLPTAWNPDNSLCSGYNCTDSEMGHLYYVELGNSAGGPLINTGPFFNVMGHYWLGEPDTNPYWYFDFQTGYQGPLHCFYAWAVQDVEDGSDVLSGEGVISEPATFILLVTGVLGLMGIRRKS